MSAYLTADLNPPSVNTIYLYGITKDTPTLFRYSLDNKFDEELETINVNWDDTVPYMSLLSAGLRWRDNNNDKVLYKKTYDGQYHTGVFKNNEYTEDFIQLLQYYSMT